MVVVRVLMVVSFGDLGMLKFYCCVKLVVDEELMFMLLGKMVE